MIRYVIAMLLLLLAGSAMADHRDRVINTASKLRDWCKDESEASFIGRGSTPYNWSASFYDEGNTLVAKGQWRVDGAVVTVECRVARGARAEYASMSIQ